MVWLGGIWAGYIPGMVYTWYIPGIYPPPKSGPGYIPISGPAAGGPPGPPRGCCSGGTRANLAAGVPPKVWWLAFTLELQLIVVHVYSKYFKADIQI